MAVSERHFGQRLVGMGKRYGGALTVVSEFCQWGCLGCRHE
jgi:hypothetical protein